MLSGESVAPVVAADDNAYRAIGRWVVEFSQLVFWMRSLMIQRLSKPSEYGLLELAFGEATAGQIAASFFALCKTIGNLDESETAVSNKLRDTVGRAVTRRNDFAHGDW